MRKLADEMSFVCISSQKPILGCSAFFLRHLLDREFPVSLKDKPFHFECHQKLQNAFKG